MTEEERLNVNPTEMAYEDQQRGEDAYNQRNERRRQQIRTRQEDQVEQRAREAWEKVKGVLWEKTQVRLQPERIGTGAYAEVYRGIKNRRTYAIKVIDLVRTSERYRGEINREMDILGRLNHPRIITVYNLFKIGRIVVVMMEFAHGGTLSDLVARYGLLREPATRQLFKETLRGLAYMHSKMIAHRDIKLENILLTRYNIPKLADFSFSIRWDPDEDEPCTDYLGSLPFFSPQLLGRQPYNPYGSDIWALGVCLYVMSNDKFPFEFEDPNLMLEKQLRRDWRLRTRTRREYPRQFVDLINHMLEPSQNARIRTLDICRHSWSAINPPRNLRR